MRATVQDFRGFVHIGELCELLDGGVQITPDRKGAPVVELSKRQIRKIHRFDDREIRLVPMRSEDIDALREAGLGEIADRWERSAKV